LWITWNQFGDFRWCTTSVGSTELTWCSQFYPPTRFHFHFYASSTVRAFFLHCSGDFLPRFLPPFCPHSTPFHSFSIIKVGSYILTVSFSISVWFGFCLKLWVLFFSSVFVSFQWFGEFIDSILRLFAFRFACLSVLGHHCFSVLGHHYSSRGMFFIEFEVEN